MITKKTILNLISILFQSLLHIYIYWLETNSKQKKAITQIVIARAEVTNSNIWRFLPLIRH